MTSISLDVVVVPVAVMPAVNDAVRLLAYSPHEGWLRAPASSRPLEVATALLKEAGPSLVEALPDWEPQLEDVGFGVGPHTSGVTLLYTTAVPVTTPMMDAKLNPNTRVGIPYGWVDLLDDALSPSKGGERLMGLNAGPRILDYWRQQLEETTAAFDLLPKYFTTPQVRAVYDAVWSQRQDPGNFHKWLHSQNEGICAVAQRAQIAEELEMAARAVWSDAGLLHMIPDLSIKKLAPSLIGTTPLSSSALGATSLFGLAAAAAGGLVAYQASRNPGTQPEWYTRSRPERVVLQELYAPRPRWLTRGAVVREPSN